MTWQPEDLTSQIDGVTDTFSTTFERNAGKFVVLYIDGLTDTTRQIPKSEVTELNSVQFKLNFVPSLLNGDTLTITYDTDEILSGRVVGLPDDPSTIPPPILPTSLEQILAQHTNDILSNTTRIEVLEAGGGGGVPPPAPSTNVDVLPYAPGVALGDVVFYDGANLRVDRASAAIPATIPSIGFVKSIDGIGPGLAEVQFTNILTGFSGLIPGKFYVVSRVSGKIVPADAFSDPDYPQTGDAIQVIGQAITTGSLLIRASFDKHIL